MRNVSNDVHLLSTPKVLPVHTYRDKRPVTTVLVPWPRLYENRRRNPARVGEVVRIIPYPQHDFVQCLLKIESYTTLRYQLEDTKLHNDNIEISSFYRE